VSWLILINIQGCPLSFFSLFFLKEPYWLAHHQFFQNIGHSPIEVPLWTPPPLLIRNKCGPLIAYLFSSYTGELNLGKPYETKLRCFWERLGNLRNPMGTHWEQRREKENLPSNPPLPPQKKTTGSLMSACWAFSLASWRNFYFQNCLSPFLAWANGRGMNCGT
jgi:hypothetical protein